MCKVPIGVVVLMAIYRIFRASLLPRRHRDRPRVASLRAIAPLPRPSLLRYRITT